MSLSHVWLEKNVGISYPEMIVLFLSTLNVEQLIPRYVIPKFYSNQTCDKLIQNLISNYLFLISH